MLLYLYLSIWYKTCNPCNTVYMACSRSTRYTDPQLPFSIYHLGEHWSKYKKSQPHLGPNTRSYYKRLKGRTGPLSPRNLCSGSSQLQGNGSKRFCPCELPKIWPNDLMGPRVRFRFLFFFLHLLVPTSLSLIFLSTNSPIGNLKAARPSLFASVNQVACFRVTNY
jgi:hypothetical protein